MPRDGSAVEAGNACPKAHATNAGALPGRKVPPPQNAVSFQMESNSGPCDLVFMDLPMTQTSPAEFQFDRRHTETDSTLRLSGAGHSRSAFDTKSGHAAATGSGHVVLHPSKQGGPAPKQARPAGTEASRHPRQAGRHPRPAGRHPRPASTKRPAGTQDRQAGRQRQTTMNRKKRPDTTDTNTPTRPHTVVLCNQLQTLLRKRIVQRTTNDDNLILTPWISSGLVFREHQTWTA